ncbi:copper homeostasis protein CutC [Lacibacter luteus]|uniref:PF03932 family protein CutC n=1 Tax=Lacibacter luteus TaxID=2508719 RepID=A0A4Q1CGI2_9BACT|nr:copper homeostasis protein CutC [Lacibacter luteus]RXK58890.1 copper homeostasis protein CutC [Lacibacter luteus]
MKRELEVCAFTVQSCVIAEKAGAVRVELCDNPIEGGTTPSYGTIKRVREAVSIDVFPIIRPRSMNYFYDADEWQIVLDDIKMCKELACNGVSVGAQLQNGLIDKAHMQQLVELAYPMKVTCNRAFDAVPDPFAALETLIECGCERILTSGLAASAPEGIALLKQLVHAAGQRISIMPGAGVRSSNIVQLAKETGAYEFHTSARKAVTNTMTFANPHVTDAGNMYLADEEELRKIVGLLQQLTADED